MYNIMHIYLELLKTYGPQGWWPVTPTGEHKPKYGVPKHNDKQKLEIFFGAILTQNTQWKPNVERAILELNKKNLIDIDRLLKIPTEELAHCIRSAGYYNQKAKKLKNVAAFLKKHPLKELESIDLWEARRLLLGVNGIGPETADSIVLYALEKPIFVVDAYTRRMFNRLGLIKTTDDYMDIQAAFHNTLIVDAAHYNEYHALIVEHNKQVCRSKPLCHDCFLQKHCDFGQTVKK
jgi:endonuclease III related protein